MDHEERLLVEVQQLGVALERRDEHPVEGEERHEDEEHHRDVDAEEAADEGVTDLDPLAPVPVPGLLVAASAPPAEAAHLLGSVHACHHSGRRRRSRTPAITIVSTGKRNSETAAPT